MSIRTNTDSNRSFTLRKAARSTTLGLLSLLLAMIAMEPGQDRMAFGSSAGTVVKDVHTPTVDARATGLLDILEWWLEYLRCGAPFGEQPSAWLTGFNDCWAASGLPADLTPELREQMLSKLDALEHYLEQDSSGITPELYHQTSATINEIRQEILAIMPGPVPVLVVGALLREPVRGSLP